MGMRGKRRGVAPNSGLALEREGEVEQEVDVEVELELELERKLGLPVVAPMGVTELVQNAFKNRLIFHRFINEFTKHS